MKALRLRRRLLLAGAAFLLLMLTRGEVAMPAADDGVFARSKALYASLRSYSDSGTVDKVFGPPNGRLRERHTFNTFFQAPNKVYFDFIKYRRADRYVAWSNDGKTLHLWWKTTGAEQTYPPAKWQVPMLTAGPSTEGSLLVVLPWLLPKDNLIGTLTEMGDISPAGEELVNGHKCFKLTGTARSTYGASGYVHNVRATTLWIDSESLLVRKVFEDTPQGSAKGWTQQTITTFEPQANPNLDDNRFQFNPAETNRKKK